MNDWLIRQTIQRACGRIIRHQRPDGAFSFYCEVTPLPDALMVICLHLLGQEANPLIPRLCDNLLRHQHSTGAWLSFSDQPPDACISATTLALFALRLSGYDRDSRPMKAAKDYIALHGGLSATSHLTKVVLATAGQIPWTSLPQGHIEVSLLGPSAPLSVFDLSAYARLHLLPYMVLRHLGFHYRVPEDKSVLDLRLEGSLFPEFHLPFRNELALMRCEQMLLDRFEDNGTLASYLSATTFAVFALQALGYSTSHPVIAKAIHGMRQLAYPRRQSIRQQVFSSTVWDTALSMRALHAAGVDSRLPTIQQGAQYLISRQHRTVSDWSAHAQDLKPGGWGFSDINARYPDLDDTASALEALYPLRQQFPLEWRRGLKWLLGMQNDDGGFAAFERNCNKAWLEHLPINDMGQAMTDPPTADLTGRIVAALVRCRVQAPSTILKARDWLLRNQNSDGSWKGRWGICYLYGTWAATVGLRASGVSTRDFAMHRAMTWLVGIQNADGGFGESCQSDTQGKYVALGASTPSQTAWALMAMMAGTETPTPEMRRAANYLLHTAQPQGGWLERYPTGAAVAGQAYIRYHSYPYVWPVIALCQYLRQHGNP